MHTFLAIFRLALEGLLLGVRIWNDEKLRNEGRREAFIDSAARQIRDLRRFNEIDKEVFALSPDDIFNELRKRTADNTKRAPRPD